MSLNASWARALRTIVVVSLLAALVCAMLGSIALDDHPVHFPDSAGAPEAPSPPPRGANLGTTHATGHGAATDPLSTVLHVG